MIILIIRRNASASGLTAIPAPGQTAPRTAPATRPMRICVVSDGPRRLEVPATGALAPCEGAAVGPVFTRRLCGARSRRWRRRPLPAGRR